MKKLYKFYKPKCAPCYSLSRILRHIEVSKSLDIVELNVEESENQELAKKNGIDKVPALLFENGNKLIGLKTELEVTQFLNGNLTL